MKNRGFVILISDLLTDEEEFVRGIHQLVCAGHNVIVFQVLDHDELTFPYEESTRFTGLESDDELTTEPGRLRQQYLDALGKMIDRYRIELGVGVDHVLVDTSQPVGSMLASYLSARSPNQSLDLRLLLILFFLFGWSLAKADIVLFDNGGSLTAKTVQVDSGGHFVVDGQRYAPSQIAQWLTDHPATVGGPHGIRFRNGRLHLGRLGVR